MNGQDNDNQETLDLPQPQLSQAQAGNESGVKRSTAEVAQASALEKVSVSSTPTISAGQPTSLPIAPTFTDPVSANPPGQIPLAPQGLPAIADDNDLIEKEWVNKAKEIVARTKLDPHQQNEEFNKVKVDYLKKRYNKELKLSEDT